MLEIILLIICLIIASAVIPSTIHLIQYKLEQRKINNILNYFETRIENNERRI